MRAPINSAATLGEMSESQAFSTRNAPGRDIENFAAARAVGASKVATHATHLAPLPELQLKMKFPAVA